MSDFHNQLTAPSAHINHEPQLAQPTLVAVAQRLEDIDGRLSALINSLAGIEENLNGSRAAEHPDVADVDQAPPMGTLGRLSWTADNLDRRLGLLSGLTETLAHTLGES